MGRQVNFYFVAEDEKQFLSLIANQGIVILRNHVKSGQPEIYDKLHIDPGTLSSDSQTYLCFRSRIDQVVYTNMKGLGFHRLDETRSPVIEFDRSGYKSESNLIISG